MAKIQIKSEKLTPFGDLDYLQKCVWLCTNSSAPKRKNFLHSLKAELMVMEPIECKHSFGKQVKRTEDGVMWNHLILLPL